MYVIVDNKDGARTKVLIRDLLYDMILPRKLFNYDIVNASSFDVDIETDRPVIVLGLELFQRLTGDTKVSIGETVWSDQNVRFVANYSLEQLHNNANLFHSFWRNLHIPYNLPVKSKPDTDNIEIIYDIPNEKDFKSDIVAFDVESSGFNPRSSDLLLISISDGNKSWIIRPNQFGDKKIRQLFENKNIKWLAHNGKFDQRFLINQLNIRLFLTHDSLILHYILDERKGTHGLKELTAQRLGLHDYEAELKKYLPRKNASYSLIPKPVLEKYAAIDSYYTHKLFIHLNQELLEHHESHNLQHAYRFVMEASEAFLDVEENGLLVDYEALLVEEQRLIETTTELAQNLIKYSNNPGFNPRSPKQVGEYIYDKCKYSNPKVSKSKSLRTTDAATINKLAELHPDDMLLKSLVAYRQASKILSTYVLPFKNRIDDDGRLRPSYKIATVETGRTASDKPNIQNIPRVKSNPYSANIRSLIVAPPNEIFVLADYSQAELRAAAILSKEDSMYDAFIAGIDLHLDTAIRMFGKQDISSEERTAAKTINFAVLYGAKAGTISKALKIPTYKAQKFIDLYFKARPKLHRWLKSKVREHSKSLELVTLNGRMRRFPPNWGQYYGHVENQFTNTDCQSLASDACMQATIWMNEWCKKRLPTAKVVLSVHDNIGVQCKIVDSKRVGFILTKYMEKAGRKIMQTDWIPLKVDVKYKTKWE